MKDKVLDMFPEWRHKSKPRGRSYQYCIVDESEERITDWYNSANWAWEEAFKKYCL